MTYKKIIRFISINLVSIFIVLALVFLFGMRFNSTDSYPIGFYWTTDKSEAKGDLVMFCPPDNAVFKEAKKRGYITYGFCEGDYGELLKRLVAIEGDSITVSEEGVFVNEIKIANSKPFIRDSVQQQMPIYRVRDYVLRDGEVLLMSDHNKGSFDARYFGVIKQASIKDVVTPLLTK